MTKKSISLFSSIIVIIFALAAAPARMAAAQKEAPPTPQVADSIDLGIRPVEVRLNPVHSSFSQSPPVPRSGGPGRSAATSAAFMVDYVPDGGSNIWGDACTTFPEVAKVPIEYSAAIWASQLNGSVPIHIEACWSNMGTGILGHSGARAYYRDFTNAPQAGTWYPIPLANILYGSDINGINPEIVIAYNSDYLNDFYYGTDSSTPGNKINFATVVLHEIAHGLGFSGFMSYSLGSGSWGSGGYPASYDRFTVDGSNNLLTNPAIYPNPSIQLGTALTNGAVYFNGANARAANGGSNVKLYAPPSWASGSSYSHLDYTTFSGTPNRLMTYAVSYGETNYAPGPVTMGILTDVGWPYPPTGISISNANVTAGLPVGTLVGTLTSIDPNLPEDFTYSLVAGGADNASFSISSANLLTNSIFAGAGSKSIRVRSTDHYGLSYDQDFTISVLPAGNQAPTGITLSAGSVAENQPANTTVGLLTTTDPNIGDTFGYSLVSTAPCPGTDNTYFNISDSTLRTNTGFNFETKSSYAICLRTTDQGSLTYDKVFNIAIADLNEAPTGISLSAGSVAENQPANTSVGTLATSDPDAGNTFNYSLVSTAPCPGTDNALFNLSGTALRTSTGFNFEANSTYSICVRTTDQGALAYDKSFTITITNLNEAPTGISMSAGSAAENQPANTTAGTLTSSDPDAGSFFSYSLVSTALCPGVDNADFAILGDLLQSAVPFDYEVKSSYAVCVRSTDQGALVFDQALAITVTNVNEAATEILLSAARVSITAPVGAVVGALTANDPDTHDTLNYLLTPGFGDNDQFILTDNILLLNQPVVKVKDETYAIQVEVCDAGGLGLAQSFTIQVVGEYFAYLPSILR